MAIALVGTVSTGGNSGSTSQTVAHTVGSGSDLYLVVGVACATSGFTPSSVTFNSVAMTQIGSNTTSPFQTVYLYGLANPSVTTANVVVSWSGSVNSNSIFAATFSGVDQTTSVGTAQSKTTTGGGTTQTLGAFSTDADDIIIDLCCDRTVTVTSVGTQTDPIPGDFGSYSSTASVTYKAGGASVNMDRTFSGGPEGAWIGIPLLASGGVATPVITDADDEAFLENESAVTITGTGFGSTQGSGVVKISQSDDIDASTAVTQTVNTWSDTSIEIGIVRGSLPVFNTLYLFVRNNDGESNASGYTVQLETTPITLTAG